MVTVLLEYIDPLGKEFDSLISFLKGVSVETEIPLNPPLKFREPAM